MELNIPELMCHNTKDAVQKEYCSNMYVYISTPLFSQMWTLKSLQHNCPLLHFDLDSSSHVGLRDSDWLNITQLM